jgi:outer membrane murein-binding lipoprotein Lpp
MRFLLQFSFVVLFGACSCSNANDQEIDQLRNEVASLRSQLEEIEASKSPADDTSQAPDEDAAPPVLAHRNGFLKNNENSEREMEIRELQLDVERMKWDKVRSDAQASFEKIDREKCERNTRLGLDC